MAMPDSQGYSLKLCLINYELELHAFVLETVILICDFSAKVTCAFLAFKRRLKDLALFK